MVSEKKFVHLHLHTDYSLLDGACRASRLFERVEELGMPAAAITDHGNVFGVPDFIKTASKHNVKPIIGCEIYTLHHEPIDVKEKHQLYHTVLLAKNLEGYKNLSTIVSMAHTKGFYYRPRANFDLMRKHSAGLICLTGCLQGYLSQALLRDDWKAAQEGLDEFVDIFGRDNLFIEVQNHGIDLQEKVLPMLFKLADDNNLPVVATNDCHYVLQSDWAAHDAMLCVQTGAKLSDENRMRMPMHQFYVKSREEMLQAIGREDALDNTLKIADMCQFEMPYGQNHYPVFKTDKAKSDGFSTNLEYLTHLCHEGLKDRYGVEYSKIDLPDEKLTAEQKRQKMLCDRIDYELSILAKTGFIDYFLIVADFINWAKKNNIVVGPGRGSGAGCILAYLLQITDIDPIAFNLIFERFLNPERVSPPDFDIDFCMRRREEVIDYVRQKYGNENVANIITFGTFGAKVVLRDLFRVHDVPYQEADRIAKMVPDDLKITLKTAVEKSTELRLEVENSTFVANVIQEGEVLEGMSRNSGTHACGVVISDRPMYELVPVTLQDGALTTQFTKDAIEDLGLLKMDFLGLKTLTVISDAEKSIRMRPGFEHFDIAQVPLDDKASFDLMNSGDTTGVFQFESIGIQKWCMQFGFSSIEEISALSALYRPGPMDWLPDYIAGKKDPTKIKYSHPLLESVCKSTYGILVFQEQVMKAAQVIAGYSMGGADILRRAMGKKKPEAMAQQREVFIKGAAATNNISREKADEIFSVLEKFAGYGFNKSHSDSYAIIGYRTAYLKAHFPIEFMAALMSCDLGNADKIEFFIAEAERMGIPILGPDVNVSRAVFTPYVSDSESSIRFGLSAIKGVGDVASENIITERDTYGRFTDFFDFAKRVDMRVVNKRVFESLILSGAFDKFGHDRKHLMDSLPNIMSEVSALDKEKNTGQVQLFDMLEDDSFSSCVMKIDTTHAQMMLSEKLSHEKELLGFYTSGHPLKSIEKIVHAIDTPNGAKVADLPNNTKVVRCGVVGAVTRKVAKKSNRLWAYFDFEMLGERIRINCFPECYDKIGSRVKEGEIVIISGSIRMREDMPAFSIEQIYSLQDGIQKYLKRIVWKLDASSSDIDSFITSLREYIFANEGDVEHEIVFVFPDGRTETFKLASSLKSSIDVEKITALTSNKVVKNFEIVAK